MLPDDHILPHLHSIADQGDGGGADSEGAGGEGLNCVGGWVCWT